MAENEPTTTRMAVLTLEFNPLTFELKIGGSLPNLNCGLAMLAQATRELERRMNVAIAEQSIARGPSGLDALLRRMPS